MKDLQKKYDCLKTLVIKRIANNHDCTTSFVRQCIKENSDKHSLLAEDIRKEFEVIYKKATENLFAGTLGPNMMTSGTLKSSRLPGKKPKGD